MKRLILILVIISALVIFSFPAQLFAGNADDFAEAPMTGPSSVGFVLIEKYIPQLLDSLPPDKGDLQDGWWSTSGGRAVMNIINYTTGSDPGYED
jgi:hypothetical protein